MKTVGFIISKKENEKRRALLPEHLKNIKNKQFLYFEKGYGHTLGYTDDDYLKEGVNVVAFEKVIKCDILCDPKIGEADYLSLLAEGQTIFGWIHAVQNSDITSQITGNKLSAIAWEDMFENGRHTFWRNNEIAGEAGIIHAFSLYGKLPRDCNVALIGRGNTSRGAYKVLTSLGANIVTYDRNTEKNLRNELHKYDVIVNAILWDTSRKDHIIYKKDLLNIKKPGMIVDISCDEFGAIETSIPTTIHKPTYFVDKIMHYVVDHTPSLVSYSVSKDLGKVLVNYINLLVNNDNKKNTTLKDATIIENGVIIDRKIIDYQKSIFNK